MAQAAKPPPSVVVAPPVKSAKISFDSDPTKTEASIKIPSVIKAISDGAITIPDVTVRSKY